MLKTVEYFVGDLLTFLQAGAAFGFVADQSGAQTLESCAFNDTELFVQVLADLVELSLLDRQCTSITLNAVASEDLYVDDSTFGTGRYTQGSVFNVAGFFTEDGTQQFFFRSQLGLAFRSDLCLLYTSPSPRDQRGSRMPSSA